MKRVMINIQPTHTDLIRPSYSMYNYGNSEGPS